MSAEGFLSWHEGGGTFYLLDKIYLDGRYYTCLGEVGEPLKADDADGASVLEGHDGTGIIFVPFRGEGAPLVGDRKIFTIGFLADDEVDYRRFKTAKSRGRAVDFCFGDWEVESFVCEAGRTYGLYRRSADSLLTPPPAVSFAPRFFIGDDEEPGAGSVTGSRFTAAVSGEVNVYYMPIYTVNVATLSKDITDVNTLLISSTLEEAGTPDFSLG